MMYILDDLGYIEEFSPYHISCNNKNCVEYTGNIPEGYETLEEWVINANIRAYKIVEGNLVFDAERDAELQEEYKTIVASEMVHITTKNEPPDSSGNWTLIDKEFSTKVAQGALKKSSSTSEETGWWSRSGHTIQIDLRWKNSKQLNDDTVTVGTLNYATLGVKNKIPMSQRYVGFTDGGDCALFVEVGDTGTVYVVDVIPDTYVSTGSSNFVTIVLVCPPDYMLDEACNKFYWKKGE